MKRFSGGRCGSVVALALAGVLTFGDVCPVWAEAQVRIKDIARINTAREYQVLGYGLVTGLDGTGDKTAMSTEMMKGMLQNMGMEIDASAIQTKNCAAVIVTGMLPAFGRTGESFDVTVSSIGDCKSLQGGVLLPTLLKGGNGQVYAVAQGNISIGGFQAGTAGGGGAGGNTPQKNHLTVAQIPNGAIQEQEVGDVFGQDGSFSLVLQRKDTALSRKVKETIERKFGEGWARISNPGTLELTIPSSFKDDPVSFAAAIDELTLTIEEPNRVVINERTGTVIVGNKVRINKVAISQSGLKIEIGDNAQRTPAGGGAKQQPKSGSLVAIQGETTVDDLVTALNSIGASPKDLIAIFQAIEAAGALNGELKIM
ncbi:MAG TPA: flagellar basal body P-ring protein FlgI [Candidatus Ozemobacteraceae bacterium]|nr:flagellar basal body P-ring protein FlgI [Candidatus Ozemobacteraceae bacterium]